MTDEKLVRQYVDLGSEAAFQQIVARYLKMVYAVCLREVQDADLAQDSVQTVFLILAQKAPRLTSRTVLSGWLFTTARLVAKEAVRRERRRRRYESEAGEMMRGYYDHREASGALAVDPCVNEALGNLKPKEREAILLRYVEERSLREIGDYYGISERAAHMRITRAMETLRTGLRKRGVDQSDGRLLVFSLPFLLFGGLMILPQDVAASTVSQIALTGSAAAGGALGARCVRLSKAVNHAVIMHKLQAAAVSAACMVTVGLGGTRLLLRSAFADGPPAHARSPAHPDARFETASSRYPVRYRLTAIGALPGGRSFVAWSINNKDEIVGTSVPATGDDPAAYYYHEGRMRSLDLPSIAGGYAKLAIDDQDTITAFSGQATAGHPIFVYRSGRRIFVSRRLTRKQPAAPTSIEFAPRNWDAASANPKDGIHAVAANALGERVGYLAKGGEERAVVIEGGRAIDLNDVTVSLRGVVLERANGINRRGLIVGEARRNGEVRGFLLTPIAEPGGRRQPGIFME